MVNSHNVQLIVPAAGESKRFRDKGISTPKPLIKFSYEDGRVKPMYQHSISGMESSPIYVGCKVSHLHLFKDFHSDSRLVPIEASWGQAHTVKQVLAHMDSNDPVLVVNSDQMFLYPLPVFVRQAFDYDAAVLVFDGNENPAYSYVNSFPLFTKAAEKQPISPWAIAGAFFFRSAALLRMALDEHELNQDWFGEEPYLSQTLNYIHGEKLAVHMPEEKLVGWGTPEQLLADTAVTKLEMEVSDRTYY